MKEFAEGVASDADVSPVVLGMIFYLVGSADDVVVEFVIWIAASAESCFL